MRYESFLIDFGGQTALVGLAHSLASGSEDDNVQCCLGAAHLIIVYRFQVTQLLAGISDFECFAETVNNYLQMDSCVSFTWEMLDNTFGVHYNFEPAQSSETWLATTRMALFDALSRASESTGYCAHPYPEDFPNTFFIGEDVTAYWPTPDRSAKVECVHSPLRPVGIWDTEDPSPETLAEMRRRYQHLATA